MTGRFDIYADDGSRDIDHLKVRNEIHRITGEYAHESITFDAMTGELAALCDEVARESHDQGYQECQQFMRGLKWD